MRNGPKTEKMSHCTKSTRPGLPYTGRTHGRVPLASLFKHLRRPLDRGRRGGSKELLKES
ncbi:hypothetical protein F383_17850 [Gossypium arboreum]|uniref:Uncharacterized protein n=1 Tax=Gossypium arboreum TaxID=29729 RepID=A0A0B0NL90_GOSAR|nr:hypothetical protein F383_17850 [Gossypium arboreum]